MICLNLSIDKLKFTGNSTAVVSSDLVNKQSQMLSSVYILSYNFFVAHSTVCHVAIYPKLCKFIFTFVIVDCGSNVYNI